MARRATHLQPVSEGELRERLGSLAPHTLPLLSRQLQEWQPIAIKYCVGTPPLVARTLMLMRDAGPITVVITAPSEPPEPSEPSRPPPTDMDELTEPLIQQDAAAVAAQVAELYLSVSVRYSGYQDWRITRVSSLDVFVNLRVLVLHGHASSVTHWAPHLPQLRRLILAALLSLKSLDLSGAPQLTELEALDVSDLTSLTVSACARLRTLKLDCHAYDPAHQLAELDLRGCVELEELWVVVSDTDVDVVEVRMSACTRLRRVHLEGYDFQEYRVHLPPGLALDYLAVNTDTLKPECLPVLPASVTTLCVRCAQVDLTQPWMAALLATVRTLELINAYTHVVDEGENEYDVVIPGGALPALRKVVFTHGNGDGNWTCDAIDIQECDGVVELVVDSSWVGGIQGPPSLRVCTVNGLQLDVERWRNPATREVAFGYACTIDRRLDVFGL